MKQAHDSARGHVTGESVFVDDRSILKKEVYVGVVGVPAAAGEILSIDTSAVLKQPGVFATYTAKDFSHNIWGTIKKDQPILVDKVIGHYDEPAVIIACQDSQIFNQVKSLVKFEIKKAPAILNIDDAINNPTTLATSTPFIKGDAAQAIKNAPHKITGEFFVGGQEHFYMESQATIAYPMENGTIEIHSSSQHPTETQHLCAHALGLNYSEVVCEVKRMGGGFGGKESQAAHFAAMAALVAHKLKRPARLALTKDDDMMMTGKRHPFKAKFTVGFNEKGKILGLQSQLYADAGAYTDLTPSILDRAMFHHDGCYHLENTVIEGMALKTNTQSNTAFRGFGGPQGNLVMESIIEDMGKYLKIDPMLIRKLNLYQGQNQTTPYGQIVDQNVLPEIFDELVKSSDYEKRRIEINEYNKTAVGKIRGLSITGCKFGIAFTARFLNQGNALVNIHLDGTLQISTGATEMGQGVNTKIATVAAISLGIPIEKIKVMTTSTEKNHNTSPTAASSGSDINGAATLKACEVIKTRLTIVAEALFKNSNIDHFNDEEIKLIKSNAVADFKDEKITINNKSISLQEVIHVCYLHRISLGEYAFFKTEGLGFNKKTGKGVAFKYFTNGAAVSEVEVETYTGQIKVLRTDILMDLGKSLNTGIDIGQISGAFVQGMGHLTTEKLFHNSEGKLLSHSPTTYKIPNIQDTPRKFNIKLFANPFKIDNVYSSKAVGEPPLLLAASVWCAIKNALQYKKDAAHFFAPATPEEVLSQLT